MIEFRCQGCAKLYKVPRSYGGKKVKCKTCFIAMHVPFKSQKIIGGDLKSHATVDIEDILKIDIPDAGFDIEPAGSGPRSRPTESASKIELKAEEALAPVVEVTADELTPCDETADDPVEVTAEELTPVHDEAPVVQVSYEELTPVVEEAADAEEVTSKELTPVVDEAPVVEVSPEELTPVVEEGNTADTDAEVVTSKELTPVVDEAPVVEVSPEELTPVVEEQADDDVEAVTNEELTPVVDEGRETAVDAEIVPSDEASTAPVAAAASDRAADLLGGPLSAATPRQPIIDDSPSPLSQPAGPNKKKMLLLAGAGAVVALFLIAGLWMAASAWMSSMRREELLADNASQRVAPPLRRGPASGASPSSSRFSNRPSASRSSYQSSYRSTPDATDSDHVNHSAPASNSPPSNGAASVQDETKPPAFGDRVPVASTPLSAPSSQTSAFQQGVAFEDEGGVIEWSASPDPAVHLAPIERRKRTIELPRSYALRYASQYGPYAAIVSNVSGGEGVMAVDLRTGRQAGKIVLGKINVYDDAVMAPNGASFAAIGSDGSAYLNVVSFVSGALVHQIPLNGNHSQIDLEYAGTHKLLTARNDSGLKASIWDLRSGQPEGTLSVPSVTHSDGYLQNSLAVSPGGKYFVVVVGRRLLVYDVSNAERVGVVEFPAVSRECLGMAFSPDGAKLAALMYGTSSFSSGSLFIVDFSSGELLLNRFYEGDVRGYNYDGPTVAWTHDGAALFFNGRVLADPSTGTPAWNFERSDSDPRLLVSPSHIFVTLRGRRGDRAITTPDLPEKDIQSALAAVQGGGSAVDAALPPLIEADLAAAPSVALPQGDIAWSYQPPAADPPKPLPERDIQVADDDERVHAVLFADAAVGRAVVQKESRDAKQGRVAPSMHAFARFELASGRQGREIKLPSVYHLLDCDRHASLAVVGLRQSSGNFDRLDVFSLEDGKHLMGWRPYRHGNDSKHREVTLARFLDSETILTVSSAGQLAVWTIPGGQPVYRMDDFGQPMAIDRSGGVMAAVHDGKFHLFSTATGKSIGQLENPTVGESALRAVFHPSGKELAAIVPMNVDRLLVRWNLETGKIEHEFPLPPFMGIGERPNSIYARDRAATVEDAGMSWRSDRYLLVDDGWLIDLFNRSVSWKYRPAYGCVMASGSPDGEQWICGPKGIGSAGPKFLRSYRLPTGVSRIKTATIELEDQLALYPGMDVAVDVQSSVDAGSRQAAHDAVVSLLENRGMQPVSKSPMRLSVSVGQTTTGEQLAVYETRGADVGFGMHWGAHRGTLKETFNREVMHLNLTLHDARGKAIWTHRRSIFMRMSGRVDTDKNVRSQLHDEMRQSLRGYLENGQLARTPMPAYVFRPQAEIMLGESQLSLIGEEPIPLPRPMSMRAGSAIPAHRPPSPFGP